MTVSLPSSPGDISRGAPFVFTATAELTSLSMEFFLPTDGDPEDPASVPTGPRETVFDGTDALNGGGTFAYAYRASSRVGSTWSIVRENGWPRPFKVAAKEAAAGGSGSISPQPALQPTLYSPLAQWALQGAPDTARLYLDRSGNSRHLTAGNSTAVADLIAGQTAIAPPTQAQAGRLKCVGQAALALTGALTVTCRVRRTGTSGCLAVQSGIFTGASDRNTLYSLYLGGGGALVYQWEQTTGSLTTVTSPLVPTLNDWSFVSFRRSGPGVPTFGVDGTYWTASGSFPVPPGGGSSFLTIGDNDESPNGPFAGEIADYCVWGTRLSDSELVPLRAAAMGL